MSTTVSARTAAHHAHPSTTHHAAESCCDSTAALPHHLPAHVVAPGCSAGANLVEIEVVVPADRTAAGSRPSRRRKVKVGRSAIGRGVFAQWNLPAEAVLGQVRGLVHCDEERLSSYSIDLGGSWTLEPRGPFRYLNHSCQPNCELIIVETEFPEPAHVELWVQTLGPIQPGEELTIDYAWPADFAIPCQCQSAACRGWVVDPEELHLIENQ